MLSSDERKAPDQVPAEGSLSLLQRSPAQAAAALLLLASAAALFAVGVSMPALTVRKFLITSHTYSIIGGVIEFWREGHWPLFLLVGGFSLLLPVFKLLVLSAACLRPLPPGGRPSAALSWLDRLGRWSMLDVFVVAVLVATVQLGVLAEVEARTGIYAFAAGVLLSMAASGWITRMLRR